MNIEHNESCSRCGHEASAHTSGVFYINEMIIASAPLDIVIKDQSGCYDKYASGKCDCKVFAPDNLKYMEHKYDQIQKPL